MQRLLLHPPFLTKASGLPSLSRADADLNSRLKPTRVQVLWKLRFPKTYVQKGSYPLSFSPQQDTLCGQLCFHEFRGVKRNQVYERITKASQNLKSGLRLGWGRLADTFSIIWDAGKRQKETQRGQHTRTHLFHLKAEREGARNRGGGRTKRILIASQAFKMNILENKPNRKELLWKQKT